MAIATAGRRVKRQTTGGPPFLDRIRKLDVKIGFKGKALSRELRFFTSQLSLMTEMGSPLNISLDVIGRQIGNPDLTTVIKGIRSEVEEGQLLSDAMGRYPHVFSDAYISMVKAGENSGQLREMLDRIVDLQVKQEKFVSEVKKALTYPIILCFVSLGVVIFLLTFVFPRFATLFEEVEDILPVTTKLLILMSSLMRSHWYVIPLLIVLCWWGLKAFLKSGSGRMILDRIKVTLPLLADIYIKINLTQMLRTLGFLMGSNVPLLEALRITRGGTSNMVFAALIEKVAEHVEEGRGMSLAFAESSVVPETAKQMIRTGEETQQLPKVMLRLSDYYEGETEDQVKKFSTIIEPLLLIIMGVVVGGIVLSLVLPIFKLSRMVQ